MFYLHEISQTITHNKLRTALTGLAVSWGIFMLIILVGMANGVVRDFQQRMSQSTSNNIIFGGGYTTKAYKGYSEGRSIDLRAGDAPALSSRTGGYIVDIYPTISNSEANLSAGGEFATGGYEGVAPGAQGAERIEVESGRFINGLDMELQRKVLVLSDRTARRLFPDTPDPVGCNVNCMGFTFKVIGVYRSNWRESNYIPYTTARVLAGNSDEVSQLTARLQNVSDIATGESVERRAIETLAGRHDFAPDDTGAVWSWNQFVQAQNAGANLGVLMACTWIIGILTLLSGIVGVSNIMFVSVRERTHEIGVRRAIGARPRQILTQIILESVAITTIFGYAGVVLGVVLLQLLGVMAGSIDGFPRPFIDLPVAFEVTSVLIIAGAAAGLFPALKALKVKPVEALRDE